MGYPNPYAYHRLPPAYPPAQAYHAPAQASYPPPPAQASYPPPPPAQGYYYWPNQEQQKPRKRNWLDILKGLMYGIKTYFCFSDHAGDNNVVDPESCPCL